MCKMAHIVLLAGVIGLFAPMAPADHIKLFILTGQSNSLGTTNGGESDPSPDRDRADRRVKFFWHNVKSAKETIGTSDGKFTKLQEQQGGAYRGSETHWGPEIEFARALYRAGIRDFGIIKASRGGGGNSNWVKGSGHMYDLVINTVHAATVDLTADRHTFEIVGLLYLQGESDNGKEAGLAGTRLKELTDNLRVDLPNAKKLYTVAAGTTARGAASMTSQEAIADSTDYIDFFPNLDLKDQLAPDKLHLAKEGKIVVGKRFAKAFLDANIVGRR